MSTTPQIKFEDSPTESLADSFTSTPGTLYPSLFDNNTMDPVEAMTPQSYEGDSVFGGSIRGDSVSGTPAPEKKPVKKRKSWGQQLPEPKTNLPPRKRAKTEDEKEQRRVERVLRNRRAAQSSRERKRQEVEALEAEKLQIERRNQDLEMRLAHMEQQNRQLQEELAKITGNNKMTVFRGSSVASPPSQDFLRDPSPVTLSQDLFGSRDSSNLTPINAGSISESHSPVQTVNPASLSPEIRPVAESSNASSSDMTQHPAAMLLFDLQCQSEERWPWNSSTTATTLISRVLAVTMLINITSMITSELLSPLSQIFTSLTTGSSLLPTPSILALILWMVTTTATLTNPSSMNSSTMTNSSRPRLSLRIRLLRRLLACSPNLARPLMDATMVAMRSASEQQLTHACLSSVDACVCHKKANSPSVEALMTLLWTIHVIEKERTLQTLPKPDAAAEVEQVCGELEQLFRTREIKSKSVSFVRGFGGQHIGGGTG